MTDPEHYALAMADRPAPTGDPAPAPEHRPAAVRTGTQPGGTAPARQRTPSPNGGGPLNPPT
ncbi:hypothetical protein [Streptomyces qinglanensis]|uniref:hypothetical protein n=1 Tax=Streptomyces qinglanensis TaxID=943816 RepID=UPI003D738A3B